MDSTSAAPVRLGIIGLGNMGTAHCKSLAKLPGLELAAVADVDPDRVTRAAERFGARGFTDPKALLRSGASEAVLVATPHFDHVPLGVSALQRGLHLLVEKPIAVHKADAQKLLRAHLGREAQIFAAMFNQRRDPAHRALKDLIDGGALGEIRRIQWTITDWFRSQAYYDSGGWRATWAGEGGGVLLNQCPHQLDLWQWLFGMPATVHAFCQFGRFHDIEVEDSVTAVLGYANGTQGVFTTTTGEAPGSNRLEIAADGARVVLDGAARTLEIDWNDMPVPQAIAENPGFRKPGTRRETRHFGDDDGGQHETVLANFADAIRHGAPLIAPAAEGIHSVELANAMLLSAWRGKAVALPLSAPGYARQLARRKADSRFRPGPSDAPVGGVVEDMSESFQSRRRRG